MVPCQEVRKLTNDSYVSDESMFFRAGKDRFQGSLEVIRIRLEWIGSYGEHSLNVLIRTILAGITLK